MEPKENPLDIFFQKMLMSSALFDQQLVLRRFNPRWTDYIESYTQLEVEPGIHIYDLLPGIESTIQAYIDRALAGSMTTVDGLRLNSNDSVFYWDASFVPWAAQQGESGFLLVVTDVTERILSRQILERKVVDRTQKLSALYDVMTIAAQPLELSDKLDQSLERVMDAVHAQFGTIHLLDKDADMLHLIAHRGLPQNLADGLRIMPIDDGLMGWVATQLAPLALADIANDERSSIVLRDAGFRSYLGVPMIARDRLLGILSGYRQSKRPFSQEDISLLDSVADQIATAIEDARLHHKNEQLLIVGERNRLARELHDAVTQTLYSLTLYAETSMRFSQTNQLDQAADYLNQVVETAQQALREMRILLYSLRPAILEQLGLVSALKQRLEAVERRVGIAVDYHADGDISMPAHVEEALYQIAQEALNNAVKHAAAKKISLELKQRGNVVDLIISDDGKGFRLPKSSENGGLGLISIRERVDSLNGILQIDTMIDGGSRVHVELDLDRASISSYSTNSLSLL